jgi:hypothetical protein
MSDELERQTEDERILEFNMETSKELDRLEMALRDANQKAESWQNKYELLRRRSCLRMLAILDYLGNGSETSSSADIRDVLIEHVIDAAQSWISEHTTDSTPENDDADIPF